MNTFSFERLTSSEQRELLALLEEQARRKSRRKLLDYYPATGPLRRELYAKHMEFFAAGAIHRERLFLAANRVGKCITIRSKVSTPAGDRVMGELLKAARPFEVWAWNGCERVRAEALPPFEKPGLHECYRVTMADGQWTECADHHQILCADGWRRLSEFLPLFGCAPPLTSLASAQPGRDEDDPHCHRTEPGCLGDYSSDLHRHDEQPPCGPSIGRSSLPSPSDARRLDEIYLRLDDLARGYTRSPCGSPALPANWDAPPLRAVHFAGSADQSVCTSAERSFDQFPDGLLLPLASGGQPRSFVGAHSRAGDIGRSACQGPLIIAANSIVSVEPIGRHKVYDFTVPKWGNYVAADLVHHNTEGAGGYETALHLTGWYPDWWPGRRFKAPVRWWAAGKSNETTRDIVQAKLMGPISFADGSKDFAGTGLIPGECIGRPTWKQGVADVADRIPIKHRSGGWSTLGLKSYHQGRGSFEGTEQDGVWLDEEPPMEVYTECLTRTATTGGMVLLTFTPLDGWSDVVKSFLETEKPDANDQKK